VKSKYEVLRRDQRENRFVGMYGTMIDSRGEAEEPISERR